jgi:hypothetical protein
VHGDLTNNVLLRAGQPPGIIDFSPYWRPPEYAEGIIVADALSWHGAGTACGAGRLRPGATTWPYSSATSPSTPAARAAPGVGGAFG